MRKAGLLIGLVCALLLSDVHSQEGAKPPETDLPLTEAGVTFLVKNRISLRDTLNEVVTRGIAFLPDEAANSRLREAGADPRLICRLPNICRLPEIVNLRMQVDEAHKNGDAKARVEVLDRCISLCPEWEAAYSLRWKANFELGRAKEAIHDATRLAQIDPDDPEYPLLLARSHLMGDDLKRAEYFVNEHLDQTIVPSSGALELSGLILERGSRYSDAMERYWKALAASPLNITHASRLAFLLASCPERAIQDVEAASDLAFIATTRLEQLERAADKSLQHLMPTIRANVFRAVAACHYARNEPAEAKKAIDQALAAQDRDELRAIKTAMEGGKALLPPLVGSLNASRSLVAGRLFSRMIRVPQGEVKDYVNSQVPEFFLGQSEVTRGEWSLVMGESSPEDPDKPKDAVNVTDIEKFLARLNRAVKRDASYFRLPTLLELRRVAVAQQQEVGQQEKWLEKVAWSAGNSGGVPHPVGRLDASQLGFHDLFGNVSELAIKDPAEKLWAVAHGGNYLSSEKEMLRAEGMRIPRAERVRGIGFRLAATPNAVLEERLARNTAKQGTLQPALDEVAAALADSRLGGERRQSLELQRAQLATQQAVLQMRRDAMESAIETLRNLERNLDRDGKAAVEIARANLAWVLLTTDKEDLREIDEGKKIAHETFASIVTSGGSASWFLLAALASAHAADDDFPKAALRVEQALALAPPFRKAKLQAQLDQYRASKPFSSDGLLVDFLVEF